MRQIAVADVGGTHARFALADIEGGTVVSLGEPETLKTAEYASFQTAWEEFGRRKQIDLPKELAIAFAGPVGGEMLKLTNNPWVIRPALIHERLGVDRYTIVNDFGAVGYAVATLGDEHFRHLCGPETALPAEGVISIVGPGTGLGVAALLKRAGRYEVIETEGGHVDFAPLDSLEDKILTQLRRNFAGFRSSASRPGRGCGTCTKRWARSRGATSPSTTTRNCGRRRWREATAWPMRRSTGSACRSVRSPETWRWRRARTRW
jgi:glucokinase